LQLVEGFLKDGFALFFVDEFVEDVAVGAVASAVDSDDKFAELRLKVDNFDFEFLFL
jgi:hypothetical protein